MSLQTHYPLPASDASYRETENAFLQHEDAARYRDMFQDFVKEGGLHGTVAGLTATPSALVAYAGGYYLTDTASITYQDGASHTWVVAHKDTVGNVGTFARVAGSHYLTQVSASQPTLPADCVWLMRVTTSAGAITAVQDLRQLSLVLSGGGGSVALLLTNRTGTALVAGDVVAISTGNDESVWLGDVAGSSAEFVVAAGPIANLAAGAFLRTGRAVVAVAGTVVQGHYLCKSATTKAAQDTGVLMQATGMRPAGAFALALSGSPGAGSVVALLLGQTEPKVVYGQARLVKSGANLSLGPFAGNRLTIGSTHEIVPSGGTALTTGGLSASTLYYIYAFMNAGVMALEASTTVPVVDTTWGYTIKTGDATRRLVGMARTNGATAWVDSLTQRLVRSWLNPVSQEMLNRFTANRSVTGAAFSEVHAEIRVEWVNFAGEMVDVMFQSSLLAAVGGLTSMAIGIDGSAVASPVTTTNVGAVGVAVQYPATLFSEGYHYATLMGAAAAGTSTWAGNALGTPGTSGTSVLTAKVIR